MIVMRDEIATTMRLLGVTRLDQLGPHLVSPSFYTYPNLDWSRISTFPFRLSPCINGEKEEQNGRCSMKKHETDDGLKMDSELMSS
jgi:hypothetical protein